MSSSTPSPTISLSPFSPIKTSPSSDEFTAMATPERVDSVCSTLEAVLKYINHNYSVLKGVNTLADIQVGVEAIKTISLRASIAGRELDSLKKEELSTTQLEKIKKARKTYSICHTAKASLDKIAQLLASEISFPAKDNLSMIQGAITSACHNFFYTSDFSKETFNHSIGYMLSEYVLPEASSLAKVYGKPDPEVMIGEGLETISFATVQKAKAFMDVMSNLITNAYKYGGDDQITISIVKSSDGKNIELSISDHGNVIEESALAKMFAQEVEAGAGSGSSDDATIAEDGSWGVGTGLAFQDLKEELDVEETSQIQCTERLGKTLKIAITVASISNEKAKPLLPPMSPVAPPLRRLMASADNSRVMIIEDNITGRIMARNLKTNQGVIASVCKTYKAAKELILKEENTNAKWIIFADNDTREDVNVEFFMKWMESIRGLAERCKVATHSSHFIEGKTLSTEQLQSEYFETDLTPENVYQVGYESKDGRLVSFKNSGLINFYRDMYCVLMGKQAPEAGLRKTNRKPRSAAVPTPVAASAPPVTPVRVSISAAASTHPEGGSPIVKSVEPPVISRRKSLNKVLGAVGKDDGALSPTPTPETTPTP